MPAGSERGGDERAADVRRGEDAEDEADSPRPRLRPAKREGLSPREAARDQQYEPEDDPVCDEANDPREVAVEARVVGGVLDVAGRQGRIRIAGHHGPG